MPVVLSRTCRRNTQAFLFDIIMRPLISFFSRFDETILSGFPRAPKIFWWYFLLALSFSLFLSTFFLSLFSLSHMYTRSYYTHSTQRQKYLVSAAMPPGREKSPNARKASQASIYFQDDYFSLCFPSHVTHFLFWFWEWYLSSNNEGDIMVVRISSERGRCHDNLFVVTFGQTFVRARVLGFFFSLSSLQLGFDPASVSVFLPP